MVKIKDNISKIDALNLIISIISNSDENLKKEFQNCLNNSESYFNTHKEKFSDRCIEEYKNDNEIHWIAMVDLLIEHNYCTELDWKCDQKTFISSINQLKNPITFDKKILKTILI